MTENAKVSHKEPRLTGRQLAAIARLMAGDNVTRAAEACGIPRRTLTRWLTEEPFTRALEAAQTAAIADSVRHLAGALSEASAAVIRLARESEDEAIRLRAALAVVSMYRELRDAGDIEARLAALEGV